MQRIINDLSTELGLPKNVILNTYKSYWNYIKNTISKIDFDSINSEQEYNKVKVNFNIPNLGKLGCSYDRMIKIKQQNKYKDEAKYKKDKTNV